ncbi:hypothetical protein PMAYCL1PPCAC_11330, partial [Pristionchus mayeri]
RFRVRFYVEPWRSDSLWSSKTVACSGIEWQMQAMIDPGCVLSDKAQPHTTTLDLYVQSSRSDCNGQCCSSSWKANVEGSLTIVNLKDNSRNIYREFSTEISEEKSRLEFKNAVECSCNYCTGERDCCLLDDSNCLTVEVRIQVKNAIGIEIPPAIDFLTPNDRTDAMFIVGEKTVHVIREEISKIAPALGQLFEAGNKYVVLEDVNNENFIDFLSVIYPSRAPIS